ncbi:MAG: YdiU family protein [Corynebacteriales bacterium]|nr:YdiU family protein [Mycobacteriales bacterium]
MTSSAATSTLFTLENTFARDLEGMFVPFVGEHAPDPRVLVVNTDLAEELGLDPDALHTAEAAQILSGSTPPAGATTIAMAYSGHQFGGYQPLLGDGRAMLLGELVDGEGHRRDLHLKGSGRTRFARGGDGRAAIGPMLREYLISEAMHALGIPTTRALAVTATGQMILRDTPEPGAVLARVASSHIRVGSFEFALRQGDPLQPLADYAIARHHPELVGADDRYLRFFEAVVEKQAALVAQWMAVGFIHGVLNTDNTTISGETIDYGPCAFMDAYDPATVFSSIDVQGRYAYTNQPPVIGWNLARFAESLIPLVAGQISADSETPDTDAAIAALTAVLGTFLDRHNAHLARHFAAKLGLVEPDSVLIDDLQAVMREHHPDFTGTFRALAEELRGNPRPLDDLIPRDAIAPWLDRWRAALPESEDATAAAMDRVNPVYIPRNHLVDIALRAATDGDLEKFEMLLSVITQPFDADPALGAYAQPAPDDFGAGFQTFCGT